MIAVDLHGQCADYRRIAPSCEALGVVLLSDAAEALGATLDAQPAGSFGDAAILSFNGNKIITTSGGGALVTDRDGWLIGHGFLPHRRETPPPTMSIHSSATTTG